MYLEIVDVCDASSDLVCKGTPLGYTVAALLVGLEITTISSTLLPCVVTTLVGDTTNSHVENFRFGTLRSRP